MTPDSKSLKRRRPEGVPLKQWLQRQGADGVNYFARKRIARGGARTMRKDKPIYVKHRKARAEPSKKTERPARGRP